MHPRADAAFRWLASCFLRLRSSIPYLRHRAEMWPTKREEPRCGRRSLSPHVGIRPVAGDLHFHSPPNGCDHLLPLRERRMLRESAAWNDAITYTATR